MFWCRKICLREVGWMREILDFKAILLKSPGRCRRVNRYELKKKFKIIIYEYASFNSITADVKDVSLIPGLNPLILREGKPIVVKCEVNSDAIPAPSITWLLGTTEIPSIDRTNTTFISITGNRTDNTKTLECSATNNNKPPKKASTTLSVECKFIFPYNIM